MRYLLLTIMMSLSLSLYASDEVVVKQSSGETSWAISSIKEISFDGNGVKLLFADDTSVYYSKETLSMLKFNVATSDIEELNDTPQISIAGNILFIPNNTGDIKIFSLAGVLVIQAKGSQVDISALSDGAYIVQAGCLTSKIIKK